VFGEKMTLRCRRWRAVTSAQKRRESLHRDIVRQLIRIGSWSGRPQTIALPSAASIEGLKSAVLIQAGPGGSILAAAKI
jgi:hypothetical protein